MMKIWQLLGLFLFLVPIHASYADFTDTTAQSGLEHIYAESWGVVSCDWNKDGFVDLVLNNHRDPMEIYENDGNGSFIDKSYLLNNPVLTTDEHGIVCADYYTDDQYLEIIVTAGGTNRNPNQYRKFFRFNEQSGLYEDISSDVDFKIKNNPGRSLLAADFDGDNHLDIFESARKNSAVPGSGVYIYEEQGDTYERLNGVLNSDCESGVILFSKYTDLDHDHTPEIACAGGTFTHGLFEFQDSQFTDIWSQVSPKAGGGAQSYGLVRDVALADFNGDNLTDLFILRRGWQPGNAALSDGDVRARLVTKGDTKEFHFFGGDEVVTLQFTAPYLDNRSNIFYGANKVTDQSFVQPYSKLQTIILDPQDNRFWNAPSTMNTTGLYIWYDQITTRWHTVLHSSGPRQQYDAHYFAASDLSDVVLEFDEHVNAYTPRLLINNGNGFTDVSGVGGFTEPLDGLAVETGDFDNDGDNDLYLVLSNSPEDYPDRYYVNDGNAVFSLQQTIAAVNVGNGESLTVADYDKDGCLDVFVVHGYGNYPNNRGPVRMMSGQCDGQNTWIAFDLDGSVPHGIGATVEVVASGTTYTKLQDGGARLFGQNAQRMHFGLGTGVVTVDVTVSWADGTQTEYTDIAVNSVYQLHPDGSVVTDTSPLEPTVSVMDAVISEDVGTVDITLTLSPTSTEEVVVDHVTEDGTALANEDYVHASGTIVFTPNESEKNITIEIIDDVNQEDDESFVLRMLTVEGAAFADDSGVVTIHANDIPSALTMSDPNISEDAGEVIISVTVSPTSTEEIAVAYATSDSTATESEDYVLATGTLTFLPGEEIQNIVITVIDDTLEEVDETFMVMLSEAVGAIVSVGTSTVTIDANDPLPVLNIADMVVAEEVGSAVLSITLVPSSTATVTVAYATVDDTATEGNDYEAASGTIVFAPGETEQTIAVAITDDAQEEPDEQFFIVLDNAQGAHVGVSTGLVTIEANDTVAPPCTMPSSEPSRNIGEPRIWVWQDCNAPDPTWTFISTAGQAGASASHEGVINSDVSLLITDQSGMEGSDTLNVEGQMLTFAMNTQNKWKDKFSVTAQSPSTMCLENVTVNDSASTVYVYRDGGYIELQGTEVNLIALVEGCGV